LLFGPPPLGPGAGPLDRLVAYGRARIDFLIGHREIARAALDGRERVPTGSQTPLSRAHIRFLLGEIGLGGADLDILSTQLTAALDAPLLLYLSSAAVTENSPLDLRSPRPRLGGPSPARLLAAMTPRPAWSSPDLSPMSRQTLSPQGSAAPIVDVCLVSP